MLATLAIVQPRLDADSNLGPMSRRFGGKSLLEWVVRRATDCQRLDKVVVAVGSDEERDAISGFVPADVPIYVGCKHDALARFVAVLNEYPAESVVRIGAQTPFLDPVLIDRLVSTADEHPLCDYIGYRSRDGRPAILASLGMFAEWCRAAALRQANALSTDPQDRGQVTRYLYSHPERFTVRLLSIPAGLDFDNMRQAIDSEEAWEFGQSICDSLGPEALDWQRIARWLDPRRTRDAAANSP